MDKFLSAVQETLDRRRMTREELAKKSGISVRTITNWYQRGSSPKLKDAYRISEALNLSLDKMLWPASPRDTHINSIEDYLLQMNADQRREVERFCEWILTRGMPYAADSDRSYGPSESHGG